MWVSIPRCQSPMVFPVPRGLADVSSFHFAKKQNERMISIFTKLLHVLLLDVRTPLFLPVTHKISSGNFTNRSDFVAFSCLRNWVWNCIVFLQSQFKFIVHLSKLDSIKLLYFSGNSQLGSKFHKTVFFPFVRL